MEVIKRLESQDKTEEFVKFLEDKAKEVISSQIDFKLNHVYQVGYKDGVNTVRDAIKWFKETNGTEYIMYGEDSFDHLLDMYEKYLMDNILNGVKKL